MSRPRLRLVVATALMAAVLAVVISALAVEAWTRATWKPLKGVPGFFLSDPMRIQRLAAEGVGSFLEVGPGRVLTGLLRNIDRALKGSAVGDLAGLEKLPQ